MVALKMKRGFIKPKDANFIGNLGCKIIAKKWNFSGNDSGRIRLHALHG